MARAFIELHSGPVGSPESANDNNGIRDMRHGRTGPESPDNPFPSVIVTGEDMVITRDPMSGNWIVEDYEGEAVLFTLPRACSLDEIRRAATVYASAYKFGFEEGRAVARSTGVLR
jgi:hypothetical protein